MAKKELVERTVLTICPGPRRGADRRPDPGDPDLRSREPAHPGRRSGGRPGRTLGAGDGFRSRHAAGGNADRLSGEPTLRASLHRETRSHERQPEGGRWRTHGSRHSSGACAPDCRRAARRREPGFALPGLGRLRALVPAAADPGRLAGSGQSEVYYRGQLPAPTRCVCRGAGAAEHRHPGPERPGQHAARRHRVGRGALVAIAIGLLVGFSRQIEDWSIPRSRPSARFRPWPGCRSSSSGSASARAPKLTLIAIGAFFPVYTNLVTGVRQIDRKLVEVGRPTGCGGWITGAGDAAAGGVALALHRLAAGSGAGVALPGRGGA